MVNLSTIIDRSSFSERSDGGHGSGMRSRHFGSGEGAGPGGASTAAVDQYVGRATPAAGPQDSRTPRPLDKVRAMPWPWSCVETPLARTRPRPFSPTPSLSSTVV